MPVMNELRVEETQSPQLDSNDGMKTTALDEVHKLRFEKSVQPSTNSLDSQQGEPDRLPGLSLTDSKESAHKPSFQMEKVNAASQAIKQRQRLSNDDIMAFRGVNLAFGAVDTALAGASGSLAFLLGSVAVADPEPGSKLLAAAGFPFAAGACLSASYAAYGRFSWAFASREAIETEFNKRYRQ